MNTEIQEALVATLHEVAAGCTRDTLVNLFEAIKIVREDMTLTYMTEEYVELHVWPLFRKDELVTRALIVATTNFTLAIPDLPAAIAKFSSAIRSFQPESNIVDKDLKGKSTPIDGHYGVFEKNNWLYFVLYASVHMYLVNGVMTQYIPLPEPKGPRK